MQLGVPVERGHALVELGIVLHRARPQRIEAEVYAKVALREAGVVAHYLNLAYLGQRRWLCAQIAGGDEMVERTLWHI
jgi:hypothetical protein